MKVAAISSALQIFKRFPLVHGLTMSNVARKVLKVSSVRPGAARLQRTTFKSEKLLFPSLRLNYHAGRNVAFNPHSVPPWRENFSREILLEKRIGIPISNHTASESFSSLRFTGSGSAGNRASSRTLRKSEREPSLRTRSSRAFFIGGKSGERAVPCYISAAMNAVGDLQLIAAHYSCDARVTRVCCCGKEEVKK